MSKIGQLDKCKLRIPCTTSSSNFNLSATWKYQCLLMEVQCAVMKDYDFEVDVHGPKVAD